MKRKFPIIIVTLAALIGVGLVSWFRLPLWLAGKAVSGYSSREKAGNPPVLKPHPVVPIPVQLDDICAELKASKDPATTRAILTRLRNLLNSLPPAVASREVQAFLASNKDAATNLDLTIKPGGRLDDSSSMRVFLLDYLGLVDKQAAGAVALRVLSHYTTPDEWAVSLRNYAWAHPGPDSGDFLKTKARELLANAAWVKDPTAGFLEAFDSIVYTNDTSLTAALSTLVRDKDNRAAAHAAYLTMDRLVIDSPTPMLKALVGQPDLMKGRELTRANFMARADLGQPGQRDLVEQYLLDPTRDPRELATFAALYPNMNYMISNNLLTQTPTQSEAILAQRDRDALKTVEQWQKDPRFKHLQPLLTQLQQRLGIFVQEAAADGR
jgi:hypothetical protein